MKNNTITKNLQHSPTELPHILMSQVLKLIVKLCRLEDFFRLANGLLLNAQYRWEVCRNKTVFFIQFLDFCSFYSTLCFSPENPGQNFRLIHFCRENSDDRRFSMHKSYSESKIVYLPRYFSSCHPLSVIRIFHFFPCYIYSSVLV